MISSFMNSFNPSASGCKIPPGPALFGPRLSCMNAATFLSAYVSYIATRSDMLMMISISMHFSSNKNQSVASKVKVIGLILLFQFVRIPGVTRLDTRRPARLMRLEIGRVRRSLYFRQVYLRSIHFANRMYIHQQPRLPPVQHLVQHFLRLAHAHIMPLRDHRMPAHFGRPLDHPVGRLLLLEPALITDPVLHFTPLILPRRDTEHFLSPVPQRHIPLAFRVIAIP